MSLVFCGKKNILTPSSLFLNYGVIKKLIHFLLDTLPIIPYYGVMDSVAQKFIVSIIVFVGGIVGAVGTAVLTDWAMHVFRKSKITHDEPMLVTKYIDGDETQWVEFRPVSNPNVLCIVLPKGQMQCVKD